MSLAGFQSDALDDGVATEKDSRDKRVVTQGRHSKGKITGGFGNRRFLRATGSQQTFSLRPAV